ncbi:uncharacterized protein LOC124839604 isoform X2 [Vigna umbellata]|uniref:uncharacterized protein LOC124839604 isoform X2 n=1 Tax=Vigna umbellata TaxID=87088 RepID=UPI001F5EE2C0|nr:uncharacterized protein LOC124839604 isoform X2 [Vigna umbellata]
MRKFSSISSLPLRHYDLMEELWGRATGGSVCATRQEQRQHQQQKLEVDLNYQMEYIPESPFYERGTYSTSLSPSGMDEHSPGPTQPVTSIPSCETSTSRGSKRKAPMVDLMDSQFEKLITKLDELMNVLRSSNSHFEKILSIMERLGSAIEEQNDIIEKQNYIMRRRSTFQYSESDVWEMLAGMNIQEESIMEHYYDFLCTNPVYTKRLMGLPPNLRWNKLIEMMMGSV